MLLLLLIIILLLIKNYYYYYYYYYYYNQEKNFPAILRKSRKFIYGTVPFSIILFALWYD